MFLCKPSRCHPKALFLSPRGVSNFQRRKVSRYARNEKISRRCLATLGTTGEECRPEPLFLSPRGVSRGVSLRYRPERCEGCLATLGRTKNGRSAGQRWAVPLRRKPRCLLFIVLLEIGDTLVYLDNFFWYAKIFSR
jgi:hypothetical protein